jgi:hypothetical protein
MNAQNAREYMPLVQALADGMSLRDYFAGQALMGLVFGNDYGNSSDADVAKGAYEYADAMLETRIKNQES